MAHLNLDEGQIRETAYYLWLEDGQPVGRDEEHWLKAIDALTPATPKRKPARKAAAKPRATKTAPKRTAKPKSTAKTKTAAK